MSKKSSTKRRPRRKYNPEFKAEAVRLVGDEGLTQAQAASDLGISAKLLSSWVRAAKSREMPPGQVTESERSELQRLRRENRVLRMERDILKKPQPSSPARP
jgi:transposase